jgi:hypothetical protein
MHMYPLREYLLLNLNGFVITVLIHTSVISHKSNFSHWFYYPSPQLKIWKLDILWVDNMAPFSTDICSINPNPHLLLCIWFVSVGKKDNSEKNLVWKAPLFCLGERQNQRSLQYGSLNPSPVEKDKVRNEAKMLIQSWHRSRLCIKKE